MLRDDMIKLIFNELKNFEHEFKSETLDFADNIISIMEYNGMVKPWDPQIKCEDCFSLIEDSSPLPLCVNCYYIACNKMDEK
jgi:hypothetical protein